MYTIILENNDDICHSPKGTTWRNHKYIKKENGRYIYPGDKSSGVKDVVGDFLGDDEKKERDRLEAEKMEANREYENLSEIASKKWEEYYQAKKDVESGKYFDKDNPNFAQDYLQSYYDDALNAELKKLDAEKKKSTKDKDYDNASAAYNDTIEGRYEILKKKGQALIDKIFG